MKPKTKYEKEVVALSGKLPPISRHQEQWAVKLARYDHARIYHGKKTDTEHFIVATTKSGWQVLRHYYLYATYRYKKLQTTKIYEVMQQWYKDGKYVFMCRGIFSLSGYLDSWCLGTSLEVRKKDTFVYQRHLSYEKVYYARLQKRFSYIPKDNVCENRIDDMFRALNTHPFNETLYKDYREQWLWSIYNDFAFDKERTAAIKIAIRYNYDFMNTEWRDMIEMLQYLGKDLCNPHYVCPKDLHKAHNEISQQAQRKRKKHMRKIEKINMVRREREQLERMRREEIRKLEQQKQLKTAMTSYSKARKKFFGLLFTDGNVEIRTLQSVDEFFEEGKELGHCVFANSYYDVNKKPFSLIMSAKVNGKRMETIEVDLKNYEVIQSRGKFNQPTEYHEAILGLLSANMNKIKSANL